MDSPEFSRLSSLRGDSKSEEYIQPHYKESYRVAIDRLVSGGRDGYQEFLKEERIGSFLSDEELLFITLHAEQPIPQAHTEEINEPSDTKSSSGTYWPLHSDVDTPDLDLGWPDVIHENLQTHIDLLFHPPRQNSPTIKEVIRKHIQGARQVVAIVMDKFTDVDIFKEMVDASGRGVAVYLLLDDFHLKSFLTMVENHNVKIPQLRNMRVRTVKGQDYLCRSGVKFHGEMEQKFLLVDCHTAIYGSYSFTWSFEKINLSMVQIIKGHLVGMYDEEFRTLYARSTVPAGLVPLEGFYQLNGPHEQKIQPLSHSTQIMERRDVMRQSLDAVYRKSYERKTGLRDIGERHLEEEPINLGPVTENGIGAQSQLSPLQCAEAMNILKRHSYAGEKQEGLMPQNFRPRGSQWNISRETGNGINNYPTDNYLSPMNRGQKMYIDSNQYLQPMQHIVPVPENISKSHMRTQRIESYLQNTDVPFGDSCDYLDQFEPTDKAAALMQGRTRSSFVLQSTIPEDMTPHAPFHYTSMQWSPEAETRMNNEEFMMKRRSLQILDENCNNANYGPGRNNYQHSYASLGRPKGGHMKPHPDILSDSWQKRHSLADPKSETEYEHEYYGHMYGARVPVNRGTAGVNAQNSRYISNLYEDQRSVSQYDVKNINGINGSGSPSWQEAPCRTVSAAALDLKGKERGSHPFSPRNPKNIKSLLYIQENRDETLGTLETLSLKSGGSTDTLRAEDEVKFPVRPGKVVCNSINPVRTSSEHESRDSSPNSSKAHSSAAAHRASFTKITRQQKTPALDKDLRPRLDRSKSQGSNNHVNSRLESSLEKKYSLHSFGSLRSNDKVINPPKVDAASEHNLTRSTRVHHETKLGKFFHRVGHFISKGK